MGNGNAEENAQDRQAAFKNALTGKHLPVLTLDNKWYRLLNKTGSVPLKETEDALNQLLKRQGKLNTESKDIRNLKKKLMKEIVPMVDEAEQQGENSKLNKQIEDHKRLIEEFTAIMDSSMYAITARWCRLPPVIIQPLMPTNLSKIQEFVVLTPI